MLEVKKLSDTARTWGTEKWKVDPRIWKKKFGVGVEGSFVHPETMAPYLRVSNSKPQV